MTIKKMYYDRLNRMSSEEKKERNTKLNNYFMKMGDPVFTRRSAIKSLYSRYSTEDVLRLNSKLTNPDFRGLMIKADSLMEVEGLVLLENENIQEVLYQMHYETEVKEDDVDPLDRKNEYERRKDVIQWREAYKAILDSYSYERLDLRWDLAWSFYVTYRNNFRQGHLKVYASIVGDFPTGLDGIPFQSILTSERKVRQRRWKDRLTKAIIAKDSEMLIELGLSPEEIQRAYTKLNMLADQNPNFESAE